MFWANATDNYGSNYIPGILKIYNEYKRKNVNINRIV